MGKKLIQCKGGRKLGGKNILGWEFLLERTTCGVVKEHPMMELTIPLVLKINGIHIAMVFPWRSVINVGTNQHGHVGKWREPSPREGSAVCRTGVGTKCGGSERRLKGKSKWLHQE